MNELEVHAFESRAAWLEWLDAHHASSPGVMIKFAKKGSGIASVHYADALDVALRYGWIDGQVKRLDDSWYLQRWTPRRARSRWSKINRAKVEQLIAAGEMHPAGLAEVERARADGRWDAAYDGPSAASVPSDLERALAAEPAAQSFFEGLDGRNRYAILHRIEEAKRPETRARRIEKLVAMLRTGQKLYP